MKRILIARARAETFCRAFSTLLSADGQLPDSIQWMPPGPQDVTPDVGGQRMRLKFTVKARHAEELNAQLQQIWADARAGDGDEPLIDFNHNDDERAGAPTEFDWGGDDPRTGGIRLRVKWSSAGRDGVLGRNWRRFSPQWGFDPDTHEPVAIDVNLGGLVNRAAFRNIAPVIAGAPTSTPKKHMTDQEFQTAIARAFEPVNNRLTAIEGRLPAPATAANPAATAAAAGSAPDISKIVTDAIKPLMDRITTSETNVQKASARAAVQPHIERGAIAPQDNDTIGFWEGAWIANAKHAETEMKKLPGVKTGRFTTVQLNKPGENAAANGAEPQDQIMAAAKEIAKASNGKVSLADAIIAQARSAEGQEQYMQFRQSFAGKN